MCINICITMCAQYTCMCMCTVFGHVDVCVHAYMHISMISMIAHVLVHIHCDVEAYAHIHIYIYCNIEYIYINDMSAYRLDHLQLQLSPSLWIQNWG